MAVVDKQKCPMCNGRGFNPKEFGREGAAVINGKAVWLYETEPCLCCQGRGKIGKVESEWMWFEDYTKYE